MVENGVSKDNVQNSHRIKTLPNERYFPKANNHLMAQDRKKTTQSKITKSSCVSKYNHDSIGLHFIRDGFTFK